MATGFVLQAYTIDGQLLSEQRYPALPIRIGRNPLNDFSLTEGVVARVLSNFHARIEPVDQHIVVRDLGSKNGVYVRQPSGEMVKVQVNYPADLAAHGYEFFLGPQLRIKLLSAEVSAEAPRSQGNVLGNAEMLASQSVEPGPASPGGAPAPGAAPMPGAAGGLPPLPGGPGGAAAPGAPGGLPPLPDGPGGTAGGAGLPPLPDASGGAPPGPPGMGSPPGGQQPPLPAESEAPGMGELPPLPALPGQQPEAAGGSPGELPPLPGASQEPGGGGGGGWAPVANAPHVPNANASPSKATANFRHLQMDALALQGLRELAGSLVPGKELKTAGDVARFITKLHDAIEVFCRCFIPLREGYAQFVSSLDLKRAMMQRSMFRSRAYMSVEMAKDPEAVAAALLDWTSESSDAHKAVDGIYADLMTHQVALLDGVMHGVRALLEELSPETIEEGMGRGKIGLSLSGRHKALWQAYCDKFEDISEDKQAFAHIFGSDFAEAYREYQAKKKPG